MPDETFMRLPVPPRAAWGDFYPGIIKLETQLQMHYLRPPLVFHERIFPLVLNDRPWLSEGFADAHLMQYIEDTRLRDMADPRIEIMQAYLPLAEYRGRMRCFDIFLDTKTEQNEVWYDKTKAARTWKIVGDRPTLELSTRVPDHTPESRAEIVWKVEPWMTERAGEPAVAELLEKLEAGKWQFIYRKVLT